MLRCRSWNGAVTMPPNPKFGKTIWKTARLLRVDMKTCSTCCANILV